MPWTRFIPGPLRNRWQATKSLLKRQRALLHAEVEKHQATYEDGQSRDLADVYIRHMKGQGPLDRIALQRKQLV